MAKKTATNKEAKFKILPDEELDVVMRTAISETPRNGGGNGDAWTPERVMLRRKAVIDLIGKGYSNRKIKEDLMDRWCCSETAVETYLRDAWQYINKTNAESVAYTKDILLSKFEDVAQNALEAGDRKSALKAYEMIGKMTGQFTDNVEIKNKTEISFGFGE